MDNVARLHEYFEAPNVPRCACGADIDFSSILETTIAEKGLTKTEAEVMRLMFKGLTAKEMAANGTTTRGVKTVKHHIAAIFTKFKVESRSELFHQVFPT